VQLAGGGGGRVLPGVDLPSGEAPGPGAVRAAAQTEQDPVAAEHDRTDRRPRTGSGGADRGARGLRHGDHGGPQRRRTGPPLPVDPGVAASTPVEAATPGSAGKGPGGGERTGGAASFSG